jgi:membrane protein DedA with SNARE-associated domain
MNEYIQFLTQYGYLLIFAWVLLDQAGLPLPTIPILLAAGALCGNGQLDPWLTVAVAVSATVPPDFIWFRMGRTRGGKVLTLLCSISLEPDSCVRQAETSFDRFGRLSLVIAKFFPGLQTIAPPVAGLMQMSSWQFLVLNTLGALLWSGSYVLIGVLFHAELEAVVTRFSALGNVALVILVCMVALFFGVKIIQRQLFLRTLRMRRLSPDEVRDRLDSGDGIHIIDLRHRYDVAAIPYKLPSADRIPMERIDEYYERIPKDKDIVLYCS